MLSYLIFLQKLKKQRSCCQTETKRMDGKSSDRIPLINPSPSAAATQGTASKLQTIGNIIVSIVGTGVLGLPFAFRVAGWLAGSLGVIIAGLATFYCMLLLVSINSIQFFSFFSIALCLFLNKLTFFYTLEWIPQF